MTGVDPAGLRAVAEAATLACEWRTILARQYRDCAKSITITPRQACDTAAALDRLTALAAENAKLREALEEISQRAESYPANVFGEPDFDAVNALLKANGMQVQMDRMHASWARSMMTDIGETARATLSEPKP